jgi:hypothetical protein
VIKDANTLDFTDPLDHDLYLRDKDIKFKEVKLNFMTIAKSCNQSITHVEKTLNDLTGHLVNLI